MWRDDDVIVFGTFERLDCRCRPEVGRNGRHAAWPRAPPPDLWHQFPAVVPSTGDIIFTVYTSQARYRLDILRWDTKARSTLLENASGAVLTASGHLLFGRDERMMVAPFDASSRYGRAGHSSFRIRGDGSVRHLAACRLGDGHAGLTLPPIPRHRCLHWVGCHGAGAFTEIGALPAGMDDRRSLARWNAKQLSRLK